MGPERSRASRLTDFPNDFHEEVPGSPHIKSVYNCLEHGLHLSNDGECAGTKSPATGEYEWLKYSEVKIKTQYLGSALLHLGLKPKSFIGIFASNKMEFFLTLFACAGYSLVLVPIYDCAGPESVEFVVKQADLSVVIASNDNNAKLVLERARNFPSLKIVIIMESLSHDTERLANDAKIQLLKFSDLEELGKSHFKELMLPKPDDLFCLPYTSGTTGVPKGVMLTHRNVTVCLGSLVIGYGRAGVYGGTIISYLPPAHLYEIMNQIASIYFARRVAFYTGDYKKIMNEVQFLKPNILPLVPRLMTAIYDKVQTELKKSKFKQMLFEFALSRKEKMLKNGIISKSTIWDKVVFKKFREALGDNTHIIVTTSAPLPVEVNRFFKCASGCYCFEAYGQTEAMAATFTLPHEYAGGHVGPPLPCNHVKLVDVPDMDYYAANDEGEVCYKGPSVCKGYFKMPEASKELIDEGGWIHSGDIGRWLPNGTLKIIDRKKNIFKLSQGEYIAPDKVELIYSGHPAVMQVYVDGFPDKNFAVAIVVPDPEVFPSWVKKNGFSSLEKQQLLTNEKVRLLLLQEMRKLGAEKNLNSLEQARSIYIADEPFSMANDLLTPTLKFKRNEGRKQFKQAFEMMYDEGPLIPFTKSSSTT